MQKVEGSSPFIRFQHPRKSGGLRFCFWRGTGDEGFFSRFQPSACIPKVRQTSVARTGVASHEGKRASSAEI
jgi:hypothetical protein